MERVLMNPASQRSAFSLVEILTVCAVLSVLLVLSVPAVSSLMRSSELQRGGGIIADSIGKARQIATAQHVHTEIRFVELPSTPSDRWLGIQVWAANPRGGQWEAATRLQRLPTSICINTNLSPLLGSGGVQGTMSVPAAGGNRNYAGMRFRADGTLERALGSTNNYVTLVELSRSSVSAPPENFLAVQVNAYTGKATIHQP